MPSEFQEFDKTYTCPESATSCYNDYKSKLHAAIYEYLKTKDHIEEKKEKKKKKKKKKKKEEDPIETWFKQKFKDSKIIDDKIVDIITQWFTNDFEYPDDVKDERIKKVYLVQVLERLLLDITEHKRNSKVFVNFKLETYHNETKKGTVIAFLKALQHEDKDPISKEEREAENRKPIIDRPYWGNLFPGGGRKRTKRKIKRKQRRKQTKRKRTKRKRTKRRTKRKRTKRTKRRSKQSRRRSH